MKHSREISPENKQIHDLVNSYLTSRSILKSSAAETSVHLDEDSLASFIEGALSQREMRPVVSHLVDCNFCLHKTAELVRLDLEFADSTDAIAAAGEATQPSKISAVISDLFSKIFGTNDDAVFAHEQKDESDEKSDQKRQSDES